MGSYVNVKAKAKQAAIINEIWSNCGFEGVLIETEESVRRHIEAARSDPRQSGLAYIRTIEQWNEAVPIHAVGRGQIFLGTTGTDGQHDAKKTKLLASQVRFVVSFRDLFSQVTGLRDAQSLLGIDVPGDFIGPDGQAGDEKPLSFSDLPTSDAPLCVLCVIHGRPDLWKAWLDFERSPDRACWQDLRTKVVPWHCQKSEHTHATVWQLCERRIERLHRKTYGLRGYYIDSMVPTVQEVLQALAPKGMSL